MNNQNLISFSSRTKEEQREMGRRGGAVRSFAKKRAAKLREWGKKRLVNVNFNDVYEIMTDRDLSDLNMLLLLEDMKDEALTLNEQYKYLKLRLEWHKIRHGSKENRDNYVQANVVERLMSFYKEVEESRQVREGNVVEIGGES